MIREFIARAAAGEDLGFPGARAAMEEIMEGRATDAQIAAFITALRMKGESVEELAGCAQVMREKATPVAATRRPLVDTAGTGGDGAGTFNISTAAAFIIAGAGLPVAKHGNRSISSRCGSADVLEALGVNLELSPAEVARCIDEAGIGFLFAPRLHGAMKYAAGPRRQIGIRTIFNVLGPLTNPAGAEIQVVGVYDGRLTEKVAGVLGYLGTKRALVVHGHGGLDEISLAGPTRVSEVDEGRVKTYTIEPADLGLQRAGVEALSGGTAAENACYLEQILQGGTGPRRDVALANAAPALLAAGLAGNLAEAAQLAARVVDSGAALARLQGLREFTVAPGRAV